MELLYSMGVCVCARVLCWEGGQPLEESRLTWTYCVATVTISDEDAKGSGIPSLLKHVITTAIMNVECRNGSCQ